MNRKTTQIAAAAWYLRQNRSELYHRCVFIIAAIFWQFDLMKYSKTLDLWLAEWLVTRVLEVFSVQVLLCSSCEYDAVRKVNYYFSNSWLERNIGFLAQQLRNMNYRKLLESSRIFSLSVPKLINSAVYSFALHKSPNSQSSMLLNVCPRWL